MGAPVEVTHNFQVDFVWKSTSFDRYVHLAPCGRTCHLLCSQSLAVGAGTAFSTWMILCIPEGKTSPVWVVRVADPELSFQDAERFENVCCG